MKTAKHVTGQTCPCCGSAKNQIRYGKTASGSQRCMCLDCKKTYTLDPGRRRYSGETKAEAIEAYKSGVSAREVGRKFGMSKGNVAKWLKKAERTPMPPLTATVYGETDIADSGCRLKIIHKKRRDA